MLYTYHTKYTKEKNSPFIVHVFFFFHYCLEYLEMPRNPDRNPKGVKTPKDRDMDYEDI